jgi:enoyl-CoA hydratase/carnithine racemase
VNTPLTYSNLQLSSDGAVVTVRMDRPLAHNALDEALISELTHVAQALRRRTDVHAVVLSGGEKFFSAGVDLLTIESVLQEEGENRPTLLELREQLRMGPELCQAWEDIEAITVAAIDGWCIGGAAALALACDFRVIGVGAQMRFPEVGMGMALTWHTLPRLAALIGPARAKRLAIMGHTVDAQAIMTWGLAEELVGDGHAEVAAQHWAARVAEMPPLAVRMTKEAINAPLRAQHQALAHADRDQFLLTAASVDLREGLNAFIEKRRGRFIGD